MLIYMRLGPLRCEIEACQCFSRTRDASYEADDFLATCLCFFNEK
ncbi:MAG: hypothetical protein V4601_07630 [Pseudomonadota bacterium]